ncbi:hypothetical protein DFP72DRAFT_636306 [Ephemerocybe angulata]|uniref:Uncharacterized protein n=1 Tax=Ephemerocybe angulata TaxID=980116 RepID=A0A8H6LZI7_9AGAR|nr:hypothetical protein DFP72DRAFT_636306 [Tulosesus angulatus]
MRRRTPLDRDRLWGHALIGCRRRTLKLLFVFSLRMMDVDDRSLVLSPEFGWAEGDTPCVYFVCASAPYSRFSQVFGTLPESSSFIKHTASFFLSTSCDYGYPISIFLSILQSHRGILLHRVAPRFSTSSLRTRVFFSHLRRLVSPRSCFAARRPCIWNGIPSGVQLYVSGSCIGLVYSCSFIRLLEPRSVRLLEPRSVRLLAARSCLSFVRFPLFCSCRRFVRSACPIFRCIQERPG